MGWDEWVVAPNGFLAQQCEGRCLYPMGPHMNVTNHAAMRSLLYSMVHSGVREPCCVPVRLASQNILFLNSHGHVMLKTFPNMIVEDCGCR